MQKIVVIGNSGSGKSTLSQQLAQKLKIHRIELDALFWNANWRPSTDSEMRDKVLSTLQTAGDQWVVDGNYSRFRDLIWQQADTVIWLKYPRHVIYWRIVIRTIRRVINRTELWHGNKETFRSAFLSPESIIWWAWSTYESNLQKYNKVLESDDYPQIQFIVFEHPQETAKWIASLPDAQ